MYIVIMTFLSTQKTLCVKRRNLKRNSGNVRLDWIL